MTEGRPEPETGPESDPGSEPESRPRRPAIDSELAVLRARLAALEREYRSAFDQAQREADATAAEIALDRKRLADEQAGLELERQKLAAEKDEVARSRSKLTRRKGTKMFRP